jgi:hypothetical protein
MRRWLELVAHPSEVRSRILSYGILMDLVHLASLLVGQVCPCSRSLYCPEREVLA